MPRYGRVYASKEAAKADAKGFAHWVANEFANPGGGGNATARRRRKQEAPKRMTQSACASIFEDFPDCCEPVSSLCSELPENFQRVDRSVTGVVWCPRSQFSARARRRLARQRAAQQPRQQMTLDSRREKARLHVVAKLEDAIRERTEAINVLHGHLRAGSEYELLDPEIDGQVPDLVIDLTEPATRDAEPALSLGGSGRFGAAQTARLHRQAAAMSMLLERLNARDVEHITLLQDTRLVAHRADEISNLLPRWYHLPSSFGLPTERQVMEEVARIGYIG
eukprot:scaffold251809_cov39-Prasinocladus_malaysianus.AAC.1